MQSDFLVRAPWLDEERVTGYAWIFVSLYAAISVLWIALSPQLIDPFGKPIGTDFMNVWAAGKLALEGQPGAAYDYAYAPNGGYPVTAAPAPPGYGAYGAYGYAPGQQQGTGHY